MNKIRKRLPSLRKVIYYICILIALVFVVNTTKDMIKSNEEIGRTNEGKLRPVIVITSSMVPAIEVNSISILQYCGINDIEIGDIVMFVEPKRSINITHRVVDIAFGDNNEKLYLTTKGDANSGRDNLMVTDDLIEGKLIKTYNWVAPTLSKFMVEPGVVNSATVMRALLMLAVAITLITLLGYNLVNIIASFIIINKGEEYYTKKLKIYKDNIENNKLNFEILDELHDKNTIKAKLAKARAVREIKSFNESTRDFNNVIKIVKYLTKD